MRERQTGGNRGDAIGRLRAQLVAAMRAHLATGAAPQVPLAGVPIWAAFVGLSRGRSYGEAGPDPVRLAELEAYARLWGLHLPPHHVELIRALDETWLDWQRTPEADRVAGELTGPALDAMLG